MDHAPTHWWAGSLRAKWQCLIRRRPAWPQVKWMTSNFGVGWVSLVGRTETDEAMRLEVKLT